MGLDQIVSRVLTEYKADTSDAKRAVKELRGVERDAAKARLAELETQNKGLDSSIATWGKVAGAIGLAYGAVKIGQAGLESYLRNMKAMEASAGANVEKLRTAFGGLVETTDVMEFAGKAMHGTWKLNQQEMETVAKSALALRKTMGVELQPTIEKLTKALQKGLTEELKEFGITAKDKIGVMQQLADKASSLGGNFGIAGDDILRAKTSMGNSIDDLKTKIGEMVVALAPAIEAFAYLITKVTASIGLIDRLTDSIAGVDGSKTAKESLIKERANQNKIIESYRSGFGGAIAAASAGGFDNIPEVKEAREIIVGIDARLAEIAKKTPKVAKASADVTTAAIEVIDMQLNAADVFKKKTVKLRDNTRDIERMIDDLKAGIDAGAGVGTNLYEAGKSVYGQLKKGPSSKTADARDGYTVNTGMTLDQKADLLQKAEDLRNAAGQRPVLQQILGTPEELGALASSLDIVGSALEGMAGAFGTAMGAWIEGSDSIFGSLSKTLTQIGKAAAIQMQVEAAKELAYGVAASFLGPIGGISAAGHFAAAAEFQGAALLIGGLTKTFGSFGGGSGARSSAGGAYNHAPSSAGGGKGDDGRNITIILGSGFYDDTPREQRARMAKAVRQGMRETGSDTIKHM